MQWAKERMWDGTRGARYEAREALGRDWKERWQSDCAAARRRRPPGAPTSPADHEPEFEEGTSPERHKSYGSTRAWYSNRFVWERSASAHSYTSVGYRRC